MDTIPEWPDFNYAVWATASAVLTADGPGEQTAACERLIDWTRKHPDKV